MIDFNNLNQNENFIANHVFEYYLDYIQTLDFPNEKIIFEEFFNLFNELCNQRNQQKEKLSNK